VVVSSLIARAFERRVMKLDQLAVGTRIGISKFTYFLLVGLGIMRYGVRSEPLHSMSVDALVDAIGPTLQRYLVGDID